MIARCWMFGAGLWLMAASIAAPGPVKPSAVEAGTAVRGAESSEAVSGTEGTPARFHHVRLSAVDRRSSIELYRTEGRQLDN